METVKSGDKRLVSYAIDLGTRLATKLDSSSDVVREIHVRRGLLTERRAQRETKTYTVHNVDAKAKTLIVEHSIRQGYRVVKPEPSETTASAYRFEVKLAAQATATLPVTEERLMDQTVALANTSSDFLGTYIQNKALDETARKQLEGIAGQKRLIAENDAAIQRGEQDINSLVKDQERLRQNISTLNQVSGQQEQVQNFARRLSDQEAQLATLRDHQKELKDKKTALQGELNKTIEALEF
jgi:DNA repair exonuclease SbcCD ATPase subunit